MMKRNNEFGFTLIEFIVVMVISVILMGIAGSIFLSSTGFFSKVTISDRDKLAVDQVAEFVIGQVKYASDVVVSDKKLTNDNYSTKPDQTTTHNIEDIETWHYFFIDQDSGRLFHDREDIGVFTESYYAGRKLVLKAKKYEFYRLDLNFSFHGKEQEETYQTTTSIVLPNVQLQYQNDGIKTLFFHGKEVDSSQPATASKGIFIYYKNDKIAKDSNIKDALGGGTVAEQLKTCMTDTNTFEFETSKSYPTGSFVWKMKDGKKIWYRAVPLWGGSSSTNPENAGNGDWKMVYIEGSEPQEGTYIAGANYYQGDVVRYFDSRNTEHDYIYFYYRNTYHHASDTYPNSISELKRWAPVYINPYQSQQELCAIKQHESGYVNSYVNHSFIYGTPYAKLYHEDEDLSLNPDRADMEFYEYTDQSEGKAIPSALHAQRITKDMVVKYNGNLYINLSEKAINPKNIKPNATDNNTRVWQRLQTKWDENSAYVKDDIVLYNNRLYRCKQESIRNGKSPTNDGEHWEAVYWETNEASNNYQSYVIQPK